MISGQPSSNVEMQENDQQENEMPDDHDLEEETKQVDQAFI